MLRVMYFTKGDASYPSSRYRAYQFAEALAQEGVALNVHSLFGAAWMRGGRPAGGKLRRATLGARYGLRRVLRLLRSWSADLVVIEQELVPLMPAALERMLLGRRVPVLIELDDAHHTVPRRAGKMAAWFAGADGVLAGNEVLAEAVRGAGGRPIVVPTCVDMGHFPEKRMAPQPELGPDEPLRAVWVGLPSNIEQLMVAEQPLRAAIASGSLRLEVVTGEGGDLRGLGAQRIPWSAEGERRAMASAHVGLMPLPSDRWSEGKCALKLLQYQAAGLACVASPVGVNRSLAEAGGVLLAGDDGAWRDALQRLRDHELRRQLAAKGRALVAAEYSVQAWAPRLAAIYRRAAEGRWSD